MNADEWNALHPVGTRVAAFPITRDEEPLITRTRTAAWEVGHGAAVVSVEGYAGGIALNHVDVIEQGRDTAARESAAVPDPRYRVRTESPRRYLRSGTGTLHLRADHGVVEEDGYSSDRSVCGLDFPFDGSAIPLAVSEHAQVCRRCHG